MCDGTDTKDELQDHEKRVESLEGSVRTIREAVKALAGVDACWGDGPAEHADDARDILKEAGLIS